MIPLSFVSREDISEEVVEVSVADCWLLFVLNGVKRFFTFSSEFRCFFPFPWSVEPD